MKESNETEVFFNIFNKHDALTTSIVKEQLAMIRSSTEPKNIARINLVTIGTEFTLPECSECHHLEHYRQGGEEKTLQHLFDYCGSNPTKRVVYIHSKGSYHPSASNNKFRKFLMSVFSSQCLRMQSLSCNTCSSRFSPLPHPHTPGNMWMATCEYINRLIPPSQFEAAMNNMVHNHSAPKPVPHGAEWATGLGRFSLEHWVHSHPSVEPCDLYPGPFFYGYSNIPEGNYELNIQQAPRFALQKYNLHHFNYVGSLSWRMYEWKALYGEEPKSDRWLKYYAGY